MLTARARAGRAARILTTAALLLAPIAACGSTDAEPKTFHEAGFAITFEYPDGFERSDDVTIAHSVGPTAKTVALAMSDDNLIAVQRYALNHPVAARDAATVRAQLDKMLGQLTGRAIDGKRIHVDGLMAFRYEIDKLTTPTNGRSTLIALFNGATEYVINCQSVPDGRDEIQRACERAIDTLTPTDS